MKETIKKSFIYKLIIYYRRYKAAQKEKTEIKKILDEWQKNGEPAPPPHSHKISVIQGYAIKFHCKVLVETGTYLGYTLQACKYIFKKLISVELDQKLYDRAKEKFANDPKIVLYKGDSGEVLKEILVNISEPCLFWLDGHYSEGITAKGNLNTPIVKELKHILNHSVKDHIILIDDARCFTGKDDYPTISELKSMVDSHDPKLNFSVKHDIIRIHR